MVCGQMLFKVGSNGKTIEGISDVVALLFSPVILCALALYGCTTILWLYILSRVKISFAYPIQALAFPIVLIASSVIFHEEIPVNRWIGVTIIVAGVYIAIYK
jgi:drug/metabolite transporter (DMT)-like permease